MTHAEGRVTVAHSSRSNESLATLNDVRAAIEAFFVSHPNFANALTRIEELISRGRSCDEADCLLVTGPPGTGKSTLRKKLAATYKMRPTRRTVELPGQPSPAFANDVPVLLAVVPSSPRPISMLQQMLKAVGDPLYKKGKFSDLSDRLDAFLEACGTTTIILDEAQRLVDRSGIATSAEIAEEIKRIHGDHGISVVLLGLGRIRHLFHDDAQLDDRFSAEIRLEPFRCVSEGHREGKTFLNVNSDEFINWRGVLQALQAQTSFPSTTPLHDEELAMRLLFATAGVMRRLKKLLKAAILVLAEDGHRDGVDLAALSNAFARTLVSTKNVCKDPFTPAFPAGMRAPRLDDDRALLPSNSRMHNKKAPADVLPAGGEVAGTVIQQHLHRTGSWS